MLYLVLGAVFFVVLGLEKMRNVFDLFFEWPYRMPSVIFVLVYVLAVTLSIAVSVMLWWHLSSIMKGETTVETHDNYEYTNQAQHRGETFINSYDLGKSRNLKLFFNIGSTGYTPWALLLPLKTAPYSDGWSWVRREGLSGHSGIDLNDQLTDEEEDI